MSKILVVEDDLALSAGLCFVLDDSGYLTVPAYTCQTARRLLKSDPFDLVILDVNLPDGSGFDLCREFKASAPELPVIFLTANDLERDELTGFDLGADDYITKPFNPIEVLARVRSQLRRYTSLGGMEQKPSKLVIGGISLDDETKAVTVDGENVNLTPIEYNILLLLMRHPGRVYSSSQIYEQVWNETAFGSEGAVAVHIRHLREKLEIDPSNPRYLKVVWGLGYKMEP